VLLGVDVGGTFTDAVLVAGTGLVTAKSPTTPGDQSEGVMAAVRSVLAQANAAASDVELFAHGMTVATNALLEGRGARTVLVATEGFTDVVELGRQARADLYRLCAAHPPPLVAPELRVAAPERTGPGGVLRALEDPARLAETVAALQPEAVAVVLLHAYAHPGHEQAIGAALAERLPGVCVSLSHEVVGTFREHERAATTEVDAALSPLLARYLRRLLERCTRAGLPEPRIMQSSGGLAGADLVARHAAFTVLSGPAGGAAGAATSSASTWAAPRATSASSRTARYARRRAARSAGVRSRWRWSTSTPSARAAARSPGPTRAERCASARAARAPSRDRRATGAGASSRPSPTPTSCSDGCLRAAPSPAE
jgi:N-methylhydantoinase A